MKQLLLGAILFATSTVYADTDIDTNVVGNNSDSLTSSENKDYSGIWKDSFGQLYTVNQSVDSLVVALLSSQNIPRGPFHQGGTCSTFQPLDLAIKGPGFFVLEMGNGSYAYTREGQFSLSAEGRIVNALGEKILTEKKQSLAEYMTIDINESTEKGCANLSEENKTNFNSRELVISSNGSISYREQETGELVVVDRIIMASIYHKDLWYFGEQYTAINPDAVDYFYPQGLSDGTQIQQGALELRSYTWLTYLDYSGTLIDHTVMLVPNPEEGLGAKSKEIKFTSESTAEIKFVCSTDSYCWQDQAQANQLNKVF